MSDCDDISGENYSYPVCITGKNLEIMRWIVEFLLSQEQYSVLEEQFRSPYLIYYWLKTIVQNPSFDDIESDIHFFDTEIPHLVGYDSFVMNEYNTVTFLYKIQACLYCLVPDQSPERIIKYQQLIMHYFGGNNVGNYGFKEQAIKEQLLSILKLNEENLPVVDEMIFNQLREMYNYNIFKEKLREFSLQVRECVFAQPTTLEIIFDQYDRFDEAISTEYGYNRRSEIFRSNAATTANANANEAGERKTANGKSIQSTPQPIVISQQIGQIPIDSDIQPIKTVSNPIPPVVKKRKRGRPKTKVEVVEEEEEEEEEEEIIPEIDSSTSSNGEITDEDNYDDIYSSKANKKAIKSDYFDNDIDDTDNNSTYDYKKNNSSTTANLSTSNNKKNKNNVENIDIDEILGDVSEGTENTSDDAFTFSKYKKKKKAKRKRRKTELTVKEKIFLLEGVKQFGENSWSEILATYGFNLQRTAADLKEQYKSMKEVATKAGKDINEVFSL